MATDAQIKGNISNAARSTGPRTDVGKKKAARNSATRGGVSGTGKALSPAQSDRVQAFKAMLIAGNKPQDSYDCLLIEDAAIARALMWECDERLAGLSQSHADTARSGWQNQKEIEASEVADQLGRQPYRTVRKLQKTRQGCQYLLELWLNVQALLLKAGALTPELAQRILDLLGTTADARAAGRTELDASAGATTSPLGRAQAIIARELARLRSLLDSPELKDACENARQRALDGNEPFESKEARLLIRYKTLHARRYQWCLTELKRRRNEREKLARLIATTQRMEREALRRAHNDPTLPAEIKALLPEVPPEEPHPEPKTQPQPQPQPTAAPSSPPPPQSRPQPQPKPAVPPPFRTGWDRQSLEAKLKQNLSKSKRRHYEQKLAALIEQERLASAPGPR